MLAKRIIPCLDCDLSIPAGRVVKGVKFKQMQYAGIPWELAEKYYNEGADEIVFLDITASHEKRITMLDVIRRTTENVFVPLTVGGGIKNLGDARKVFNAGADKISINTAALKNPKLISDIARHFGTQACVVAIDCIARQNKKGEYSINGKTWYECSIYGGREFTGKDAVAWAVEAEKRGAGEILLTSMDRDGTNLGYDLDLTRAVTENVSIPVIASGGAGSNNDICEVFRKANADAALLASTLHFGKLKIKNIKEYLKTKGVPVRT